jgi:hypothetical protein
MIISILSLVLAVLIITEGYATESRITKRDYRFISGIWDNEDYNDTHHRRAKIIIEKDGTYTEHTKTSNLKPIPPRIAYHTLHQLCIN